LHRFDNSLTQVTGQRFRHRRSPHRRINADRLAQPNRLGNPPDSNRAEHALGQFSPQFSVFVRKSGDAARLYEAPAPGWLGRGGDLVHIGVRSVSAGMAALAIGFAVEPVGRRIVGPPSAGQRTEASVFETIRPKSLDHRASLVQVASLETGFSFKPSVEESEQPASTSRHFFRRAFSLRPKARFVRRALCGRGHLCRKDRGQREQRTQLCILATARSGGAGISTCYQPIYAQACTGRFITASERSKKTGCDCGGIKAIDLTARR
jgi:hypothetical protein